MSRFTGNDPVRVTADKTGSLACAGDVGRVFAYSEISKHPTPLVDVIGRGRCLIAEDRLEPITEKTYRAAVPRSVKAPKDDGEGWITIGRRLASGPVLMRLTSEAADAATAALRAAGLGAPPSDDPFRAETDAASAEGRRPLWPTSDDAEAGRRILEADNDAAVLAIYETLSDRQKRDLPFLAFERIRLAWRQRDDAAVRANEAPPANETAEKASGATNADSGAPEGSELSREEYRQLYDMAQDSIDARDTQISWLEATLKIRDEQLKACQAAAIERAAVTVLDRSFTAAQAARKLLALLADRLPAPVIGELANVVLHGEVNTPAKGEGDGA